MVIIIIPFVTICFLHIKNCRSVRLMEKVFPTAELNEGDTKELSYYLLKLIAKKSIFYKSLIKFKRITDSFIRYYRDSKKPYKIL